MIPVLLLLILGIVEFSLITYATAALEGATLRASREGTTGYDPTGNRQAYIYGLIQNSVGGLLDPTKLEISTVAYNAFSSVTNPTFCTSGSCSQQIGSANQIVEYTVTYPWPIVTPMLSRLIGSDGIFTISSSILVKNEPFTYGAPTLTPVISPLPPIFFYPPCTSNCDAPPTGYSGPVPSAQ